MGISFVNLGTNTNELVFKWTKLTVQRNQPHGNIVLSWIPMLGNHLDGSKGGNPSWGLGVNLSII